jgi:hypothetical protein
VAAAGLHSHAGLLLLLLLLLHFQGCILLLAHCSLALGGSCMPVLWLGVQRLQLPVQRCVRQRCCSGGLILHHCCFCCAWQRYWPAGFAVLSTR